MTTIVKNSEVGFMESKLLTDIARNIHRYGIDITLYLNDGTFLTSDNIEIDSSGISFKEMGSSRHISLSDISYIEINSFLN